MKEWYLMDGHKPNITSGYEGDILSEFAQSNFNDVLETTFSDTVMLYNNDLSEPKEIRCIIQGNHAHTMLNSMKRDALFPIGTVKAGMYIYFDDAFWLIVGCPGDNKVYEKAILYLCQYKLKWQNDKGDIIERWGNFSSASKYDDGLYEGKVINLTSDNLTIILPHDEESLKLDYRRVFIDSRDLPEKVYIISRSDDVLFDYGARGGVLSFIADKTEFNPSKDNQELGVCDYVAKEAEPEKDDETTVLNGTISGSDNLKLGVTRTYTATLSDKDGNSIEWNNDDFYWNIYPAKDVVLSLEDNKAKILAEDEALIGNTVRVEVRYRGIFICGKDVEIREAF